MKKMVKSVTLMLLGLSCVYCSTPEKKLTAVPYVDITPQGEMLTRLQINYDRLQDSLFSFDSMTTAFTVREAPGDWIGRDILSLSVLSQVLDREQNDNFTEIITRIPEVVNERGYLGILLPAGRIDEGQITGHNGFLRGLNEYYLWKKDPATKTLIQSIIDSLFIRNTALVDSYPTTVLKAQKEGGQVAHVVSSDTPWQGLSTDIGQFFLTLDAITQSYTIVPSPELKGMIDKMIGKLAGIKFADIGGQTHSFLGATRGILKWYEITQDTTYLNLAKEHLAQYVELGMTENYENYNWFGRPLWTEGCAVADGFMLASQLWKVTGDTQYLNLAHLMLYNGVFANQRPNGGFGCNNCTGANGQQCLSPESIYEAPWCCSMRGSEALAEALTYTFFTDNDRVVVPFYQPARARLTFPDGEMTLRLSTDYPTGGSSAISVEESSVRKEKKLVLFVPEWAVPGSVTVTLNGQPVEQRMEGDFLTLTNKWAAGDQIEMNFNLALRRDSCVQAANSARWFRYFHGPLLLGTGTSEALSEEVEPTYAGQGVYQMGNAVTLSPLANLTWLSEADSKGFATQVLFPIQEGK